MDFHLSFGLTHELTSRESRRSLIRSALGCRGRDQIPFSNMGGLIRETNLTTPRQSSGISDGHSGAPLALQVRGWQTNELLYADRSEENQTEPKQTIKIVSTRSFNFDALGWRILGAPKNLINLEEETKEATKFRPKTRVMNNNIQSPIRINV